MNPSEPNTTKTILFTYTTDEAGNMSIDISTEGFEDNPVAVAYYLSATVALLSETETATGSKGGTV